MNKIATSYTVLFMSMAFAFGSFTRAGLFCNHQDLSPKYARCGIRAYPKKYHKVELRFLFPCSFLPMVAYIYIERERGVYFNLH